jgi:hypothetical protein
LQKEHIISTILRLDKKTLISRKNILKPGGGSMKEGHKSTETLPMLSQINPT